MLRFVAFLAAALAVSNALKFKYLEVTWGLSPFDSNLYRKNPTSELEMYDEDSDWTQLDLPDACDGAGIIRGRRYYENHDPAVILIFDHNGYIAGMQSMVSPLSNNTFDFAGNRYYTQEEINGTQYQGLTVYFVEPEKVCTGRNSEEFDETDTLYVVKKTDDQVDGEEPGATFAIPNQETTLDDTTGYDNHKCFYSMGHHHWYNVTEDMTSTEFNPIFILTNRMNWYSSSNRQVTGFGFVHIGSYPGPRFEHPTSSVLSMFVDPVPTKISQFIDDYESSTLHVFLYPFCLC